MSDALETETARFASLPRRETEEGRPRRTGVEIEFGGLDEATAAEVARACLGGKIEQAGSGEYRLTGSRIGDLRIYLDTVLRKSADTGLGRLGMDLGRAVIPVEIVTDPLPPDSLPQVDRLRGALRAAGALGSRDGTLFGFGLHLNPEIADRGIDHVLPVIRAFALVEDWLRYADPIDTARRVLPFSDPYPRAFVDGLADGAGWDMETLIDRYLARNPTRNRGLDALPVLACLDEDRVARALGGLGAVKPRPAWHYRLPDCRVDEGDWSIAYEWTRWVAVERLAASPDSLDRLAALWREHRSALLSAQPDWRETVARVLREDGFA